MPQLWSRISQALSVRIHGKEFFQALKRGRAQKLDDQNSSELFKKNSHLDQMGNFGLIVAKNYASLYFRICTKDFFQTLHYDRAQ